ncbi:aldo/keto reductase [Secundilactobacillus collinoides]|uniref:aldo/keto reductase n=1 Tax=Secundilactobacillus collinoides TaxID=33960 RepID=UPI0034E2A320
MDLYWIHNPTDVEKWTPQLIPLVKSGHIKRVGVSNHNLAQIKRANEILGKAGIQVSAVQNHFSLLYRSSEEAGILDYCLQHDIDFFLLHGFRARRSNGKVQRRQPASRRQPARQKL